MNITIQQSNQVTERNVPASIIHYLYNLGQDPNIDLSGAIQLTGGAYIDEIETVQQWYQNLYITPDKQYIRFADPVVEQKIIQMLDWSDGIGVTPEDCARRTISFPNSSTTGFKNNTAITSFNEFKYFTGMTTLGQYSFAGCSNLESISIPSSITSLQTGVFSSCSKLKKVYITDLDKWCRISLPSSSAPFYSSGGGDLYLNDEKITNLIIPSATTYINAYAFYKCTGLTSVTFHDHFSSIGDNCFEGCTSLTSVHISDLAAWCKIRFNNQSSNPMNHAKHLYLNGTEVTGNLVIPDEVTNIGKYVFINCNEITSVTIPDTVSSIDMNAFFACYNLTKVYISDLAKQCSRGNIYHKHHLYLNGDEIINLTIPSGVTAIGDYAFYYCGYITSVTIPNTVTSIGYGAFQECTQLNSIYISDLSAWFKMYITSGGGLPRGVHVYLNGTEITNLTIPNDITNIPQFACGGWSYLTQLTIPSSVTTIGGNAFNYCTGLTSVTIPNSVVSIGSFAFHHCTGLTSATFLNGATIVATGMFNNCDNLVNVTLPNSITTIEGSAFQSCTKLVSITIPSSVTTIGENAFSTCSLLREVISEATVPPTANATIFRYSPNALIYVPTESVDAYKAASGWSVYASRIQAIPTT